MAALRWSDGNPFAATARQELVVFVAGRPATQGSKSYKGRRANGSAILVESNANLPAWRTDVRAALLADGRRCIGGATVGLRFVLPRPKRIVDETTGLGQNAGDGDKLTRAVWDAIESAGTIENDARILDWYGSKRVAEPGEQTGVLIIISPWRGWIEGSGS